MTATRLAIARWRRIARWAVRRLRRIPPRELLTTVRAAVTLVAVELTIRCVSIRKATELWRVPLDIGPADIHATHVCLDELPVNAARALRAAHRATLVWPFADGPCLRRALVGGHLLRDLRPVLRLGIGDGSGPVRAHAWLEVEGRPLEDVSDIRAFQQQPVEELV